MNYLVTGITGFAGPHLAKLLLSENHNVYGLVRGTNARQYDLLDMLKGEEIEKINWCYGDLTDLDSMEKIFTKYNFDGVFHLAAQSHVVVSFENPIQTFNSNVIGSVNLINCIQRFQKECKLHFCSTSEVYGDTCKNTGILEESMPLMPCNPYGVSKASIDLYLQEELNNKRIKCFITRAFSHTGPRRGRNFSISSDAYQIAKMMLGMQENKLLIGNLKTKRVVMDVRDCVRAYYMLMLNNASGVYNVCGTEIHEMEYFTDTLIKISGLEIQKQIHAPFYRDIDIQIQIGEITKLKKEVNWTPEINIKQTMTDLLEYWVRKLKNV